MGVPRQPEQEWLPTGFPPRSFAPGAPVVQPTTPVVTSRRRGRGRWLVAAAVLAAVLLLAAGLFLATRDSGGGRLATGASTSTSAPDTSLPSFEATTSLGDPPPSIEPVTTATSAATVTTTAVTGGAAGVGTLEPDLSTLTLGRTDATVGVTRAPLTLRNVGTAALTYTTQSSSPGLSATPARGTIGPGAAAALTVTLDAGPIPTEGPFTGTLSFGGTGGTRAVQVRSTVGRPPDIIDSQGETCAPPSGTCSRLIKVDPTAPAGATPCIAGWIYGALVRDMSQVQSVTAMRRAGGPVPLQRFNADGLFASARQDPLGSGAVLRFTIEAVDQYGFARRLPDQTITCP